MIVLIRRSTNPVAVHPNTKPMSTPPPSEPISSSTPGTSRPCVYLLVSREEPEVFKLGITGDLPTRVASLASSFGACEPAASALVRTRHLRAALRLERLLQTAFDAARWRTVGPRPGGRGERGNGYTEWYRREALEEMLRLVADLIVRDAKVDVERFAIERDLSTFLRRSAHEGSDRTAGAGRSRGRARAEADGRARWEQGEVAFQRLQEFVEGRRDRLLSAGLPTIDAQGCLRRTLTFQAQPEVETQAQSPGADEWDALFSLCRLAYRTHREHGGINYLQHCRYLAADRVELEFALAPLFNSPPETFFPPSDLPRRLWAWFSDAQLPWC